MKKYLKLRNMIAIAICLAGITMFSGCDPNKTGPNQPYGDFTKKDVSSFNYSFMSDNFVPPGIYKYVADGKNHYLAVGTDRSCTIDKWNNGIETYFNDKIYVVHYNYDQWNKREYINPPQDDYNSEFWDFSSDLYYPKLILFAFISSSDCEKEPTEVKDETVAGVKVKHYTYKATSDIAASTNEYWIMKSGVCLKVKQTVKYTGVADPIVFTDYGFTSVDANVSDFNSNLAKLPPSVDNGALPTNFNALYEDIYKKYANEWLTSYYPRNLDNWIKPYTYGGKIEWMEVRHNPTQLSVFDHFFRFTTSITGGSVQDAKDYVSNKILTINGMETTSEMDVSGIYSWKGSNYSITNPDFGKPDYYIEYNIYFMNGKINIDGLIGIAIAV